MAVLFLSCKAGSPQAGGSAIYRYRAYDSVSNDFILSMDIPDATIKYRDSLVIEESKKVRLTTIHMGNQVKETRETFTDNYVFIDRRSKAFYEYRHFSDTAALLRKYYQPDSVSVDGGWNFYAYHDEMPVDSMWSLPDTTIQGITYRRMGSIKIAKTDTGDYRTFCTAYLRCDLHNAPVTIDRGFSERVGCPLVRLDFLSVSGPKRGYSFQVEYVPGHLSRKDTVVFNAWEKRALFDPVQKK